MGFSILISLRNKLNFFMPLQILLNNLKSRKIPIKVMSTALKSYDLGTGSGWDGTKNKLIETFQANDDEGRRKILSSLSAMYYEILFSSDKSVRFFKETEKIFTECIDALTKLELADNIFKENYPNVIDNSELEAIDTDLYVVDITDTSEKLTLIFCSKRLTQERIEIIPYEYGDTVKEALNDFSEVFGIKNNNKQCFDIVVFDKNTKIIEIRLDHSKNISTNDREVYFRKVQRNLQKLISSTFTLSEPVNLFPVINALYKSEEGRICELAFTTETSSIKHEKMRRKHDCLRHEAYHEGGSAAVGGNISIYRVAATWEFEIKDRLSTQPELLLPGCVRMLSQENIAMNEAIITNCSGTEDYNFIINKINDFLIQHESTTV